MTSENIQKTGTMSFARGSPMRAAYEKEVAKKSRIYQKYLLYFYLASLLLLPADIKYLSSVGASAIVIRLGIVAGAVLIYWLTGRLKSAPLISLMASLTFIPAIAGVSFILIFTKTRWDILVCSYVFILIMTLYSNVPTRVLAVIVTALVVYFAVLLRYSTGSAWTEQDIMLARIMFVALGAFGVLTNHLMLGMRLSDFRSRWELQQKIKELQSARDEISRLETLLPICAWCKKIRDSNGTWHPVEHYLAKKDGTQLTHSICPECQKRKSPAPG